MATMLKQSALSNKVTIALKNVQRNCLVVTRAQRSVENRAQIVIKGQLDAIRVATPQRYPVIQLWKLIHAKRNAVLSSAVVTAAQGSVVTATHHECMPSVSFKLDCIISVVIH